MGSALDRGIAAQRELAPIVRPKTGGVAFGDALETGETAEGRFGRLF